MAIALDVKPVPGAAAGLAFVMTPAKKIASEFDKVNLEKMIPDWVSFSFSSRAHG